MSVTGNCPIALHARAVSALCFWPVAFFTRVCRCISLVCWIQASGAGYAVKLEGKGRAVFCFFGEGAASEGDFHAGTHFMSCLLIVCSLSLQLEFTF